MRRLMLWTFGAGAAVALIAAAIWIESVGPTRLRHRYRHPQNGTDLVQLLERHQRGAEVELVAPASLPFTEEGGGSGLDILSVLTGNADAVTRVRVTGHTARLNPERDA